MMCPDDTLDIEMYPPSAQNRYIYINNDFVPQKKHTVLLNPHFKSTVFINPKFAHSMRTFDSHIPSVECSKIKQSTIICTKNKLVRVPQVPISSDSINAKEKNVPSQHKLVNTKFKLVKSICKPKQSTFNELCKHMLPLSHAQPFSTKYHKTNVSVQNSTGKSGDTIHSKYKIIRHAESKRVRTSGKTSRSLNKFAQGTRMRRFSDLIRYKNQSQNTFPSNTCFRGTTYKLIRNGTKRSLQQNHTLKSKIYKPNIIKKYKIIRCTKSNSTLLTKLKKCNIPCPIYRKFGKCSGQANGKCYKVHNPNQIILCRKFMRGVCLKSQCPLSHKVSQEKVPTCSYYLKGLCSRDDCPYLHVKISPKAEICIDFLQGYCISGAQCMKRHQFLCPSYESKGTCSRKRCPYPHRSTKASKIKKNEPGNVQVLNKIKESTPKVQDIAAIPQQILTEHAKNCVHMTVANNRYYKEDIQSEGFVEQVTVLRPKFESLPSFIPI